MGFFKMVIQNLTRNPIFPFLYLRILQIFISAIRIKLSSAEMATPFGKYKLSKSSFSSSVYGLYCRNLPVFLISITWKKNKLFGHTI